MKLTTGILAMAITMTAGAVWAQNPNAIDNSRSTTQVKPSAGSNAVLLATALPAQSAKPAPGAPAPAVKPIVLPSKSSPVAPAAKAAAKPSAADSSQNHKLEHVNVTSNANGVQIEISSDEAITPRVSKLSSPARVVVELPETIVATSQNKIPVNSGDVKGVRIGMDGKTPPTTSVVVDLEKAVAYDLTPGPSDKFVLTLHTQGVAKSTPAPVKPAAPATKSQTTAAKPVVSPSTAVAKTTVAAKPATSAPSTAVPSKQQAKAPEAKPTGPVSVKPAEATKAADAAKPPKPEDKKWAMSGKRDPFFSPVVQQQGGSGCSTGKKCLEIGNINLRGVVKSDAGFIAVVTNSLNKAYFLRENDPVFNGYVVKITGDSVVFQETVQDKLGKPFTREVVKRIFTPAV